MVDGPKMKNDWREIIQLIKEMTTKEISEEPWMCLFHGTVGSIKQYKESFIPHLLNAAKSQIPRYWQEIESPTIKDWIGKVEATYNMEDLRYSGEEEIEGVINRWKDWKVFKKTRRYAEVISGRQMV